jgi:hypothetical protein
LIPVWGIVPKVAVAYSGTYAVGHVILQWYLTGKHITSQQMRTIYKQGLINGKNIAQNMAARLRRPRLGKGKAVHILPLDMEPCVFCGKPNLADARFCAYCGQSFQPELPK